MALARPDHVTVRMYRVGFGDCLLIGFPDGHHMLVDCGSHTHADDDLLPRVADDIATVTEGAIEVVLATHRHNDHINGFARSASVFNKIRVSEVWLPWTEDPNNTTAVRLRQEQDGIAERVLQSSDSETLLKLAANNFTNRDAMEVLLHGFAGNPTRRYLSAKAGWQPIEALPGSRHCVLGPEQSAEVIKKLEVNTALAMSSLEAANSQIRPFNASWHLRPAHVQELFGEELEERELVEDFTGYTTEEQCQWLDKTINNTSVMQLLQYRTVGLLLPGDTQGDAWLTLLERAELRDALNGLDVLKVAHHGSHSGSPRGLVEALSSPVALVSTCNEPWDELPQKRVLKDLATLGPVLRSDRRARARGVKHSELWLDLHLPL